MNLIIHFCLITVGYAASVRWEYSGPYGPKNWKNIGGYETCGGRFQSPIPIQNSISVFSPALQKRPLEFIGYNVHPTTLQLINDGRTARVNIEGDVKIKGGLLSGEFKAVQFHFHWGSRSEKGSEHTINGHRFPMEMQIVHYNMGYRDLATAAPHENGTAVLAFMFDVVRADNHHYAELIEGLLRIPYKGERTRLNTFSLENLLPLRKKDFFRYHGSFTTPPCYQSVEWIVFPNPIAISETQLDAFRSLNSVLRDSRKHGISSGHPVKLVNNYRPTQRRINLVQRNFKLGIDSRIQTSHKMSKKAKSHKKKNLIKHKKIKKVKHQIKEMKRKIMKAHQQKRTNKKTPKLRRKLMKAHKQKRTYKKTPKLRRKTMKAHKQKRTYKKTPKLRRKTMKAHKQKRTYKKTPKLRRKTMKAHKQKRTNKKISKLRRKNMKAHKQKRTNKKTPKLRRKIMKAHKQKRTNKKISKLRRKTMKTHKQKRKNNKITKTTINVLKIPKQKRKIKKTQKPLWKTKVIAKGRKGHWRAKPILKPKWRSGAKMLKNPMDAASRKLRAQERADKEIAKGREKPKRKVKRKGLKAKNVHHRKKSVSKRIKRMRSLTRNASRKAKEALEKLGSKKSG